MASDNDTKNKFIELRAKGLSFDKISKELNITKSTLIKWSRGYELEIKNLRGIEIDALREKFMLTKEMRMRITRETLDKILTSLNKRNLDDVSTDKLLGHLIKLLDKIEHPEEVEFVVEEDILEKSLDVTYRDSWTS